MSFVSEGWKRINGNRTLINSSFEAKDIELYPEKVINFFLFFSFFSKKIYYF